MYHNCCDGFWGMHFFGGIFWLIIIIAIIFLYSKSSYNRTNASLKAMDILKERFARGEINEQEYMDRKSVLDKN